MTTLPTAVVDVISQQKLIFVSCYSRQPDETEYSEISISIYAPYGTYDPSINQHYSEWKSRNISNKNPIMTPSLPVYMAPLQEYLENVLRTSETNMYKISNDYFDPLFHASWAWEKHELSTGTFGHINVYADKLNLNTLTPELREMLTYFTHVVKISYYILREQVARDDVKYPSKVGYSLRHIYSGPNSYYGRVNHTGAIGVDEYGDNIYTSWGKFTLRGPCMRSSKGLPNDFVLKPVDKNQYVITSYQGHSLSPHLQFDHEWPKDGMYEKIKNGWEAIRDLAFLELQKGIQENRL